MATVTVSGVVKDETGRKDSRDWKAFSPVYREGSDGEVLTMRKQQVRVVAGMFSAKLDPGVCVLENPDGQRYTVTVPDEDADLWDVIAAAVAIPPGTPADELNAAVTAYFDANPVDVGPEGPPNVLEIGTVVSGPTAGATITGTSPTQTLNLTLPKGDKGDPGTPGTSGDWATLTNKPAVIAAGADAATARSVISAQASDSDLTAIAALTPANDDVVQRKSGAWTNRTPAQLKTDLGLTKSDVGLGNVDNTSDVNKPISTATQTALNAKQATSEKNQPNGYAGVDASGTIPASLLPSYVDDVLEYAATGNFPATGEAGKIYVATGTGKIYRWGGSAYAEISPSPGSTDAVPEGATNLYYTNARADARITAALGSTVQPYDADLAAIAALASAADKLPYSTGPNAWALATLTPFARTLTDDVDAATMRGTLGLGAAATKAGNVAVPVWFEVHATYGTRAVGYGDNLLGFIAPAAFTLTGIVYRGGTADASGSTTAELRQNGAAIAGSSKAVAAANQWAYGANITVTGLNIAVAAGDVLQPYISGIGGTPGVGFSASIIGTLNVTAT